VYGNKKAPSLLVTATLLALLTGCTVAEAASPDSKNTPRPAAEGAQSPSASPSPLPSEPEPTTVEPTAAPTPEEDVPPPFSWGEVDGHWCTNGGDCLTIEDSSYTIGTDYWLLDDTGAEQGCFQGTVENIHYPGSLMMYCPAGTPTPFTIIHPAATSAAEAVLNDDPSQARMWFYNGLGADTYFRQ
jgi:hypothetical protein